MRNRAYRGIPHRYYRLTACVPSSRSGIVTWLAACYRQRNGAGVTGVLLNLVATNVSDVNEVYSMPSIQCQYVLRRRQYSDDGWRRSA